MHEPKPYPEREARVARRLANLVRAMQSVGRLAREIALDLGHLPPADTLDPTGDLTNRKLARLVRGIGRQLECPLEALRCDLPLASCYLLGEYAHDPADTPDRQEGNEFMRNRAMTMLGIPDFGPDGEAASSDA